MRSFLLTIVLGAACALCAQDINTVTKQLAESAELRDGRFSFYAIDQATGKALVEHDIHRKMSPASTLKLLTSYAALDVLGADHRFRTRIGYTGSISDDGVLKGDLVIEAGGDPVLDAKDFKKHYGFEGDFVDELAKLLRSYGVISIEGKILINESYYQGIDVPNEWTWEDMGNYFAAGAHAFTFQENKFEITFSSGAAGASTKVLRTDALNPGVQIENHVVAANIRSDQAYIYASPKSNVMHIHGRIPAGKTAFDIKGAMPNPAEELKAGLESELMTVGIDLMEEDLGITLRKGADGDLEINELMDYFSPELIDIVNYMNMHSSNLIAEHLIRQIGKKQSGEGSFNAGIKAVKAWCGNKGIDTRGLSLSDGSGLSRSNTVSTAFMVGLLDHLAKEEYYIPLRDALPIAGISGSMRRIGKDSAIHGHMYAKTGYIEDARGYSGYLLWEGQTILFAILANDYDMSASAMRKEMSKLLTMLPAAAKSGIKLQKK